MKRILCLPLALLPLAGCGGEPELHTGARTPAPVQVEATVESAPAATGEPTPEPSASPTPVPEPATTLADWTAAMPAQKPDYSITEGAIQLQDYVAWPDQPVVLEIPSWKGTLEEAAEAYGVSLETLQSMNPDPETWTDPDNDSVTYYSLKLRDDYVVPEPAVKYVTVSTPWVASNFEQTNDYMVPGALSDQAAACMATAYDFQYEHYGMQTGIWPAEYDEATGRYYTGAGGLYTTYSDLTRYLESVYTPEVCATILGGPVAQENPRDWHPYYQGENDTICFYGGDRGSNIQYCGTSFTEPEVQPDGSIQFWQLSLTVESDAFTGWGEGITYTPDTANATIVRLEPTETGWRVAKLELPN